MLSFCGLQFQNDIKPSQSTGLFGYFDQHNPSRDKWRMEACVIKATYSFTHCQKADGYLWAAELYCRCKLFIWRWQHRESSFIHVPYKNFQITLGGWTEDGNMLCHAATGPSRSCTLSENNTIYNIAILQIMPLFLFVSSPPMWWLYLYYYSAIWE